MSTIPFFNKKKNIFIKKQGRTPPPPLSENVRQQYKFFVASGNDNFIWSVKDKVAFIWIFLSKFHSYIAKAKHNTKRTWRHKKIYKARKMVDMGMFFRKYTHDRKTTWQKNVPKIPSWENNIQWHLYTVCFVKSCRRVL